MTSNTVRRIVVDDTDPEIRYSGMGWFVDHGSLDIFENSSSAYLNSLHGTNNGGSLAYTFQGTGFQVFGTTRLAKTEDGNFDPSWECFIDNVSVGATNLVEIVENNRPMCEGSNLIDGQHQLTVHVTTTNHTFWIDKILYTPSPRISLPNVVVVVQNQDPGIFLDSAWQKSGGTAKMTQVMNSEATVLFTGTSLTWVGSIPPDLPHDASNATYSVDGGPEVSFPLVGLPPGTPITTIYNEVLFETPDLSLGPHSLVVKHLGTSQQTPLTLDFLYITTSLPILQNYTSSPSPSPDTFHNIRAHNPPHRESNTNNTPIGAIIGGVIGGLGLIALVLLLFLGYKRVQRRAKFQSDSNIPTMSQRLGVSPYVYKPSASGSYTLDLSCESSTSTSLRSDPQSYHKVPAMLFSNPPPPSVGASVVEAQPASMVSRHEASASISSGVVGGGPSAATGARESHGQPLPPVRPVIEHEDSGLRLNRESVIHVP